MRRLLRWTLNTAASLSAVLCLATAVLWVRSTSRLEGIKYLRNDGALVELETHPHGAEVAWVTKTPPARPAPVGSRALPFVRLDLRASSGRCPACGTTTAPGRAS